MTNQTTKTTDKVHSQQQPALPTFMDHVQELKSRLFWVAVFFVLAASATYPFTQKIVNFLVHPLGHQQLYYMSPAGGLSFMIKVCMYAGFIGVLPVLTYHLYKFISPVMKKHSARRVLGYTFASTVLALIGISFAYFVSLPAALHFLTNIGLNQVTAMLTIDAYMSFIIAYLLSGALLFQLPLIMIIINHVTPLSPKKLMNYQRHIIVGSFIIAALVSPTPDAVNQTILAAPMIVMYQIGIIIIWLQRRAANKKAPHQKIVSTATVKSNPQPKTSTLLESVFAEPSPAINLAPGQILLQEIAPQKPASQAVKVINRPPQLRQHADAQMTTRRSQVSIDGLVHTSRQLRPRITNELTPHITQPRPASRSLDGFFVVAPSS